MLALLKSFFAPLLSLVFMISASGLFNTFVSLRLEIEKYSTEEIGIVTSALYIGILLGSLKMDRWIYKKGHVKAFVILALVSIVLTLAQAAWVNSWYWAFIRVLCGICTAGVFIVIESWLLMMSPPNLRGFILSVYLAVFYVSLSSGQLLIDLSDPAGKTPFFIVAGLLTLSIFPISLKKGCAPQVGEVTKLSMVQLFRISPHGFLGGVISGMLLAVVYGLGPVFASSVGMNFSEIGLFMAVLIFGGFSLQWPFGRWADKTDRRKVLNIASFATTLLGLIIGSLNGTSFAFLLVLAWLFGGFSFTIYPISMAYACERVKENQIVSATGGFVLSYGMGAIAGPLLAPLFMNRLGPEGLFYFISFITLILGLVGLKRPAPAILD